jgi:hypothetical protein
VTRALFIALAAAAVLLGPAAPTATAQYSRGGARSSQQAVGTWWDRTAPPLGRKLPTSRYYSIRSDLPPADTKAYADHLDVMYDEFARRLVSTTGLKRRSPEFPNVLMFAKQQDYLDTLRTQFGINGTGSGGMFFVTPRGAGLAFWVEGLPRQRVHHVVQHEGFHQFAYAFFGNELPPWLNEGLAEFFGESVVEGKRVIVGQASPQAVGTVRAAVEQGKHIPFPDLLLMDSARWNGNVQSQSATARIQYPQSWSMVHFLVYAEDGRYEPMFSDMLRRLNNGVKPLDAMKQSYSLDTDAEVSEFEARWRKYAVELQPGAYVSARGRLEFLAEGLREVWGKGARPETLEQLKAAMREAKFRFTANAHGYSITMDAADDANFQVPDDAVNAKPAVIELVAQKPPKGAKQRKLEDEHPTPPMLRTRNLRPNDVGIQWYRNPSDPSEFAFEVVVN